MAICSIKLPGTTPAQSGYHWAPFPASSPPIFWPHPLLASVLSAGIPGYLSKHRTSYDSWFCRGW